MSGLEKEVKAAAPAKGFEFGPPKYLTFAGGCYVNVREAAERVRMLENQGLMKRVTAEEFYSMDPAKRQQLFKTVSEAFDKPLEDYDAFQKFVKYVAIKKEKEEQKYSTKRW